MQQAMYLKGYVENVFLLADIGFRVVRFLKNSPGDASLTTLLLEPVPPSPGLELRVAEQAALPAGATQEA